MNDPLMIELLERARGRYFGKYRGTVTEVDAATMRIKAEVPNVLPGVATGWCMPCVPYAGKDVGMLMLPDVGAGVWIEFESGDVSYPIWVGCYWRSGEVPDSASAAVKSIVTTAGVLAFDTGANSVTLKGTQDNTLVLDGDGATVSAGSGRVAIGNAGVSVNDGALEVS
jgi:phage baseplate assembly protein gpV